jgi:hypothetical protein
MLAYSDRDTLDQFEVEIGQLETITDLILSNSHTQSRQAVILLDHFADVQMYRKCLEVFSHDAYFKFVIPERFSGVERREILKYFAPKVGCIQERLNLIPAIDAVILRIGHQYRNAIYHRDTHNSRTINTLARILFEAVGRVYVALGDTVSVGGVPEESTRWLTKYGFTSGMVEIPSLRKEIIDQLTSGLKTAFSDIKASLVMDVEERAKAIADLLRDDLPIKSDQMMDDLLREKEFYETKPVEIDKLSDAFKQIRYQIQTQNPPTREEYVKAEDSYHRNLDAAMKGFTPSVTNTVVKGFTNYRTALQSLTELGELLTTYYGQDRVMSRAESYFDQIYSDFESAVQLQIDIAREK